MTTPLDLDVAMPYSIIGKVNAAGHQFIRDTKNRYRMYLPVGSVLVQLSFTGKGGLITQLRYASATASIRPEKLQVPVGSTLENSPMVELPIHEEGSYLTFTCSQAREEEVGQPILSVRVYPLPPQA